MCIIFLVSGIQLFCTGIVGQYLSKTYLETKRRPVFILKEDSREEAAAALKKRGREDKNVIPMQNSREEKKVSGGVLSGYRQ